MSNPQTEELMNEIKSLPKEAPTTCEGLIRELYKNISEIGNKKSETRLLSSLKAVSCCGLSKELSKLVEENGLCMEGLALVLKYLTTRDELAQYLFATSEDGVEKDGLAAVKKRLGPKLEVLGGLRANGVDVTKDWVVKLVRASPSLQSLTLLSAPELQNICNGATSGENKVVNSLLKNVETRKKIAAGGGLKEVAQNDASGKAIDPKKLEKAKALMNQAKEMSKQQSDEAKKAVSDKLAEIKNLLPSEWNAQNDEVKPEKLLGKLDKIVDQLINVAAIEEYKSDLEIMRKVSGGRALCGIYHSEYVAAITAELPIVKVPNELILSSPNNSLQIRYVKFLKSGIAANYVQKVKSSSTSIGLSIAGFYGTFAGEVSGGFASRNDEDKKASEKKQMSSASVVQCIWIATKTFKIEQDQLNLTESARNMARMVVKNEETSRLFMQRYGSHFPAGLQTLGGVLFRIADVQSSSTKSTSEITEKAAQQLQSQLSVGFLGGAGGIGASVTSENSSSSGSVHAQEKQTEDITYTFTSQAMGPAATDPNVFSTMLSKNSTWALIDRGSQRAYLPVWELLRYLGKAFEAPADILEKTWLKDEAENKQSLIMMEKESELKSKMKIVYVSHISFVATKNAIQMPLPNMIRVDMNEGSEGKFIYPVINYSDRKDEAISGLSFIQDYDPVPSGYTKIEQDLNEGAGGNYNYLCIRKGGENKMTAIHFTLSHDSRYDNTINGYFRFPADLNTGAKKRGNYVYLLYKTNTGKRF